MKAGFFGGFIVVCSRKYTLSSRSGISCLDCEGVVRSFSCEVVGVELLGEATMMWVVYSGGTMLFWQQLKDRGIVGHLFLCRNFHC